MGGSPVRRILVSGASIAGPSIAYWLHRHGFDVTVVERSGALRSGGYLIDIRGTAMDVVERMGILPELQAAHVDMRKMTFLNGAGEKVGTIRPHDLMGSDNRDLELPRGALTSILYDKTRSDVEYRFNDSIASLDDHQDGVDVAFQSGRSERFDLVIAADGLHSRTRGLVFGPEEQFSRYLGYTFLVFSVPNVHGLAQEGLCYNRPGKLALLFAPSGDETIKAVFVVKRPEPSRAEIEDVEAQRRFMTEAFAGDGGLVPDMLTALQASDDLYGDAMMQIFMPKWSSGRVALVGDAAYGPSFFSGQGTSIALVGAYVLAGEIAARSSYRDAFDAYERTARSFVEANQATAKDGCDTLAPATPFKLWLRNRMIGMAPLLTRLGLVSRNARRVHSSLTIKNYEAA